MKFDLLLLLDLFFHYLTLMFNYKYNNFIRLNFFNIDKFCLITSVFINNLFGTYSNIKLPLLTGFEKTYPGQPKNKYLKFALILLLIFLIVFFCLKFYFSITKFLNGKIKNYYEYSKMMYTVKTR